MTFFAFIIILLCSGLAVGQSAPELVDEFGRVNCKETKARVDALMSTVNASPESRAVISISAAEKDILHSLIFEEMLRGTLILRNYDSSQIQFVRSKPGKDLNTQFWIIRPGTTWPSDLTPMWNLIVEGRRKAVVVDTEWFYGDDICPPVDGTKFLAELLDANPHSRSNVVARPGSRFRFKRGREAFLRHMRTKHHTSNKRISFFFVERKRPRSTSEEPDAEFWFVP